MNRREFLSTIPAGVLLARLPAGAITTNRKQGVMLMNRIGPSVSELYIANIDGTNERTFLESSAFDYHASYAPDGTWVVFTSERNGDGQSDLFRCRPDGTGIEPLVTGPSTEDVGALSPDGTGFRRIAFKPGWCLGSPKWSPDGRRVVFCELPTEDTWGAHWPNLVGNVVSQIVSVDVATGERTVHSSGPGLKPFPQFLNAQVVAYRQKGGPNEGLAYTTGFNAVKGAMRSPTWSPDGQWIAFGLGVWFQERARGKATLMRMRRDGTVHTGFPSYSADGKQIVFRVWGEQEKGLRILDLPSRKVWVLTTEYDNLPGWSPDGRRIVFTRKTSAANVDVFTIRPDGTGLRRLTTSGANDGHAVWTYAGRIMWNSCMYGFRDEVTLYDDTFQPYGQIFVMHADGSNKRIVTDSLWEDSMPLLIPARFLSSS